MEHCGDDDNCAVGTAGFTLTLRADDFNVYGVNNALEYCFTIRKDAHSFQGSPRLLPGRYKVTLDQHLTAKGGATLGSAHAWEFDYDSAGSNTFDTRFTFAASRSASDASQTVFSIPMRSSLASDNNNHTFAVCMCHDQDVPTSNLVTATTAERLTAAFTYKAVQKRTHSAVAGVTHFSHADALSNRCKTKCRRMDIPGVCTDSSFDTIHAGSSDDDLICLDAVGMEDLCSLHSGCAGYEIKTDHSGYLLSFSNSPTWNAHTSNFIRVKQQTASHDKRLACQHFSDYTTQLGTVTLTTRATTGIEYVLDPASNNDYSIEIIANQPTAHSADRIMVVDGKGSCGRSTPAGGRTQQVWNNLAPARDNTTSADEVPLTWRSLLRFKNVPVSKQTATYKVCYCDSQVRHECSDKSDYAIEIGTLHVSSVSCLLTDSKFRTMQCVEQEGKSGLRCSSQFPFQPSQQSAASAAGSMADGSFPVGTLSQNPPTTTSFGQSSGHHTHDLYGTAETSQNPNSTQLVVEEYQSKIGFRES